MSGAATRLGGEGAAPVAVTTVAFDGHPLAVALDVLAELDVEFVELAYIEGYGGFIEDDFDLRHAERIARLLGERGQRCRTLSAHIDLGGDGAILRMRRRAAFAAALGASTVITNASDEDRRGAFRGNIAELAGIAAELGIRIALENPGHGRASLFGDAAAGRALLQGIGSDRIGLNYDVGNVVTYSEGRVRPERDVTHALGSLLNLHLKDVRFSEGAWRFTPLGAGEIDLPAVLAAVAAQDLAPPITLELPLRLIRPAHAAPLRRAAPVPLAEIRAALEVSLRAVRRARQAAQRRAVPIATPAEGRN